MIIELNLIQTAAGFFLVATDDKNQLHHDFFLTENAALNFAVSYLPYHGVKLTKTNTETAMMQEIKTAHVASASLSQGGWAQMTQSDWGATGQMIREQYDYLRNFASQIASGEQALDGRALVRADLYADAVNGTYSKMETRDAIAEGFDEEIRDLESGVDHCDGCIEQAGHWEPIGTLDEIGDEECSTRCRCEKRYRNSITGEER